MKTRRLGTDGPTVSAIGLGCMRLGAFGKAFDPVGDAEAVATVQAAIDRGISFIDTGDFYGGGHSEAIVGQALRERRDRAFLSVKFGAMTTPSGRLGGHDGRPMAVKNFATYSLQRLGVEAIDLYQIGRPDPDVPYEETIGAIAELIAEGKVRHLGVSEVGVDLIRRAHAVHPVTALEIEWSPACRFVEPAILPAARALGIGVVAYRAYADGLLTGSLTPQPAAGEAPAFSPRLEGENRARNVAAVAPFFDLSAARGVTPSTLAIAWLLARGDDVVPIVGASRRARLDEMIAAVDLVLSDDDLAAIERVLPVGAIVGARYPQALLAMSAR